MAIEETQIIISAVDRATAEIAKVRDSMEKASNDAKKQKDNFSSLGLSVAKYAGAYLSLKTIVIDSISDFIKAEEVQKKLETIVLNLKGQTMEHVDALKHQASALATVGVLSDSVIMSAQAQLATFDLQASTIQKIIPGLMDMIVSEKGVGASMEDAKNMAQGLGKAFLGQYDSLKKQGFAITETQKKMIEFGNEMEKAKAIAEILGHTYEGANRKMLDSFGGRLQWTKNQVSSLSETIGGELLKALMSAADLTSSGSAEFLQNISNIKIQVQLWTSAIANAFVFLTRATFNSLQIVYDIVKGVFWAAGAVIVDFVENVNKILHGDFNVSMNNFDAAWEGTKESITTNVNDMQNAFENAFINVDQTFDGTTDSGKTMAKSVGAGLGEIGDASEKMADKLKSAAKKFKDLKEQMSDAIKSAKNDIQELKRSYNDESQSKKEDLANSIAQVIVQKEKDKAQAQSDYQKATTQEEKDTNAEKIRIIDAFFTQHQMDMVKYSQQIVDQRKRMSLDEVDTLKQQFEDESKQRAEDYKKQLSELKSHLKEVKNEYKKKLKELKEEIKDAGLDQIKIDVILASKSSSSSSKKRAVGGGVMTGEPYTVGENGPETFIPDQSGRIVNSGGASHVNQYFSFDMRGASVRSDEELIAKIQAALSRRNELISLGSQAI